MTHLIDTYGLWVLFVVVLLESGGIPVPGETALITTAVLASKGHFSIIAVIAVASGAAILGDNGGYWVGREWGRQLLTRWDFLARYAERVLPPAERFFERHGSKTVFIGRFLPVLRFTAAWMAGIARMPWWKFFAWNAAGGIAWATGVGLLAYYLGKAVLDAYDRYGLIGAGVLIGAAVLLLGIVHFVKKRLAPESG